MASATVLGCLIFTLALQFRLAKSNDIFSPILSPSFDDVCKDVECGKGSCKASVNTSAGYTCECNPGWKQASHDDLKFMPCVIPNCTLNFSCTEGPSPAQEKEKRANESIFDTCYWADCGGGTCTKTSIFTHKCQCSEGYNNLFDSTAFPCFRECALGMDCSGLGITIMNKSVSSPPSLAENSHGGSIHAVDHYIFLLPSLAIAIALWK